ncbi:MAG: hypothetical protein IMZ64_12975 [Bacteroidetes bacterium]|nr:hypothetical protein [Bacteroidota bacterium]
MNEYDENYGLSDARFKITELEAEIKEKDQEISELKERIKEKDACMQKVIDNINQKLKESKETTGKEKVR